jgi:hypothetical protein
MTTALYHPMMAPLKPTYLSLFKKVRTRPSGLGDFWSDLGTTLWDAVTGLTSAIGTAFNGIVQGVTQVVKTIALVVEAAIGKVPWSAVLGSLGKIFQDVGVVLVALNPLVMANNFLSTAPLTSQAFALLNKYTGNLIVNVANVSSLVGRAMAGDPITAGELIIDALTILEVASIVIGGPVALGAMVGSMGGRQICQNQTKNTQAACNAVFSIVGSAVGDYAGGSSWVDDAADLPDPADASPFDSGIDYSNPPSIDSSIDLTDQTTTISDSTTGLTSEASAGAGVAVTPATSSFVDSLENASVTFLENAGVQLATRQAIQWCQQNKWAGNNECKILAQATSDFLVFATNGQSWTNFLAQEVIRLGTAEIMLNWFPKTSPEYQAIAAAYVPAAVAATTPPPIVTTAAPASASKLFLVFAGIALLVGVS